MLRAHVLMQWLAAQMQLMQAQSWQQDRMRSLKKLAVIASAGIECLCRCKCANAGYKEEVLLQEFPSETMPWRED
jgi:hypothetical protein